MKKPYEIKNPKDVEKEMKKITDGIGMPIDKKMLRPSVILNSLDFVTSGSCEGHNNRYFTYPWIDIDFPIPNNNLDEAREFFFETLYRDLEEFYENRRVNHEDVISFQEIKGRLLTIRLSSNCNIKILNSNRNKKIKDQLQEILDFCEFLNKKYNLNY